jgi:hypothetical protein
MVADFHSLRFTFCHERCFSALILVGLRETSAWFSTCDHSP